MQNQYFDFLHLCELKTCYIYYIGVDAFLILLKLTKTTKNAP